MFSGHQEFFFLVIWWAGYFFSLFSHKLSITFVLHAIFFFRQALAGNFYFQNHPSPPSPQELNGRPLTLMGCREGTGRVSLSMKVLLIFLFPPIFLIQSFLLFFLFSQSGVPYFPIFLSNHAAGTNRETKSVTVSSRMRS